MTLILFILAFPFLMFTMAVIVSIPLTLIDYITDALQKIAECRQLHKYFKAEHNRLAFEIQVWTIIAKECDSCTQAEDKGYAIARLVNLHHQLEELDNKRRSIPWIRKITSTQAKSRAEYSQ